jgi:hypothetical protein
MNVFLAAFDEATFAAGTKLLSEMFTLTSLLFGSGDSTVTY